MWEMIKSGGWLMAPLLVASVLALAIVLERAWTLRSSRVAPRNLLADVWTQLQSGELKGEALLRLQTGSPLGTLLAAGLINARHGRDIMKESIEDAASAVVHEMERYLTLLGTIAQIAPLLGLLGTVVGMIEIFGSQAPTGTNNPAVLAHGISIALYNTAFGLIIAIPALMFYRYFRGRVDEFVLQLEMAAERLLPNLLRHAA